jgi:uncharacterized protein YfdQ (DUF2303 family)
MTDNINMEVEPAEGTLFIKYQEPTEYIPRGANYRLRSTQAVIDLINKRGSVENTQIFYLDTESARVEVILDDTIMDREKDLATYAFEHSDLFKEWESVLGGWIDQKEFIDFLKRRDSQDEFPDVVSILASVQQLKMATEITGDYSYDDRNNYTFAYKVRDMEGTTRLPNSFIINIPLLNESDLIVELEMELEVGKPKEPGVKPGFKITCPKLPRYLKRAINYEIDDLKTALPDYNIMAGSIK